MAEFHLSQKGSRTDKVEANGYFGQLEENSTYVSGEVRTGNDIPGFILVAAVVLVVVTVIAYLLEARGNPGVLDGLRFLVSFWFTGSLIIYDITLIENYRRRKAMIALLQKILS